MSADLTYRELLELAAMAAGLSFNPGVGGGLWASAGAGLMREWNPLTDDGDAFRLAVKLGLRIRVCDDLGIAFCTSDDVPTHQASEGYGSDRYAATRRAIVRAAAAIGRSKA
jgi:hypothetical protein